jgi:multidrug transporter EmrE-like cation transporter
MANLGWLLTIVVAIVAMESCAMTCLKRSKDGWSWFMAGIFFYIGVATLLAESLKLEGLAIVNALWSGISVMATTTVGVLYFKEVLHFHDYVAVAMIGAGVVILKVTP